MSHAILLWILVLSCTGVSEATSYPEQSWDELVTRLRAIDSVSGRTAGFYAVPGEFFNLSEMMIRVGKEEDFRKLLSDEQAVVRCMGLLGLAQVKGKTGAPTIRSYLYDPGKIDYCPGGCCVWGTTVGHFAWNLLLDANHLKHADVPAPLLTESERIALELEFLASDSLVGARPDATSHLTTVVRDGILVLQLSALKAHAPALEDYRIIKGIGRLKPSVQQRDFLIACLQDRSLDSNARLAAGSALTHYTDDVSLSVIQNECNWLNALDMRHWGEQFIETLNARKIHETNMEPLTVERAWVHEQIVRILPLLKSAGEEQDNGPLLAKRTWQKLEDIKDRVVVAYTCRHPLALSDLLWSRNLSIAHADPDVRRAVADSLVEISRNLKDYSQPWSTYADSASILALRVQVERQTESQQMRTLTDAECDEVERNIAESIDHVQERQALEANSGRSLSSGSGSPVLRPTDQEVPTGTMPLLARDVLWRLVAQSHLIVTGTLHVPGAKIRSNLASGNPGYVELTVAVDEAIKGKTESPLVVSYFTRPALYAPDPHVLMRMDEQKVLLFLVQGDGFLAREHYFAGYTRDALQTLDSGRLEQIRQEVLKQADILRDFNRLFPPEEEPLYQEVKRLIDATTRRATQMQAFAQLEELGFKAVPAIIMLMDDRRPLAIHSISLQNRAINAFEASRHYGPETVVDALAAILNQVTGQDFGSIYNGGSEQMRQETVNGWRIYLYYLKRDVSVSPGKLKPRGSLSENY